MQIYGLRSRYTSAIKKAKIIERPELSALTNQKTSDSAGHSRASSDLSVPEVSRHGLSALFTPDDPSLHRQVAHQAGASYADEARVAAQIKHLKRTLLDIRNLQHMSTQLGPAVYA